MTTLTSVSQTSLFTLKARIIESQKNHPLLPATDIDFQLINGLTNLLPPEIAQRTIKKRLPATLTRYIALRTRKYDTYTKNFIKNNPGGLVVNLGCGFDTRYWRVSEKSWNYLEIDLPTVIDIKKEILKDKLSYKTISCSVLAEQWIRDIQAIQNKNILFLAEGLFMYLPQKEVEGLFKKLSETFSNSAIIFETVNKKYTRGFWKKIVKAKMKRALGSDAGSSYKFGVSDAKELESYGKNIRVTEEWSYFEDKDIRPKILRIYRNVKSMSRTQWTIKAMIG